MNTALRNAALPWIVALATIPMAALADAGLKREALYELALDIDNDGRMDRAVLVLVGPGRTDFDPLSDERYGLSDDESVDLYVYLSSGDEKVDLSQKPAVLKTDIVDPEQTQFVFPLESTANGSLTVGSCYGCGAMKSWEEALTIVQGGGEFLVARYTRDWEWGSHIRTGDSWDVETIVGGCDIDFLTGKGVVSDGLDENRPLERTFKPVRLADWSAGNRPEACEF
jgi:hypothetical protein